MCSLLSQQTSRLRLAADPVVEWVLKRTSSARIDSVSEVDLHDEKVLLG